MAFTLRKNTYVPGDPVGSAWLNGIATDVSRAMDGTNGGSYTPTAILDIGGAGLRFSGSGVAGWPQLSSRGVTTEQPLVIGVLAQTSAPAPSVTQDESDIMTTIGGVAVGSGALISPVAADAAHASHWVLQFTKIPNGATLNNVHFVRKGDVAGGLANPPDFPPTYTLVRWAPGGTIDAMSTVDQADTGTWNSLATQTMLATTNNVIDTSQYCYGLLVKNPHDLTFSARFRIYSCLVTSTATSMQL